MKKALTFIVAVSLVATPTFAQIRPQDCRPVLPVLDDVAQVAPLPDVVAEPAVPVAQARRGFFGLPFLLPLLAVGGLLLVVATDKDKDRPVSPA